MCKKILRRSNSANDHLMKRTWVVESRRTRRAWNNKMTGLYIKYRPIASARLTRYIRPESADATAC